MDILSLVLRSVRLSGAVLFRGEFSSPWSLQAPDSCLAAPRAMGETSSSWLETNCRYMLEEASANRPGGASVLGRLAELLFVEVLRRKMEELGKNEVGWLAAVKDPTVGKALELMHADLAHPWTVETLGRSVGLSRSALAERFRHLLGEPLMRYLTRWRLQWAAQLLRDTDRGLADIASQVGYESELAFNRAFKRFAGEPPASWRRDAKGRDHLSAGA